MDANHADHPPGPARGGNGSASAPALPEDLAARAEARYADYAARAREAGLEPAPLDALPGDARRVWACSEFVARGCQQAPREFAALLRSGDLETSAGAADVEASVDAAGSVDELVRVLREHRRREHLRVAWRDLAGLAGLEETVANLSRFADRAIGATLDRLHRWACRDLGEPRSRDGTPQFLVVIAMGKLGCRELNFSSDIDLIFTYPENGETAGGRRTLTNDEFFLRLGRQLIDALAQSTEAGFVFRVDMRLRPFGEGGPLVVSFNALEDYYQMHGRDWERYALIRARPVTGDPAAGRSLLARLRPFVYRRYLDFGALEAMREMKDLITREVARKGIQDNVKLGAGGIRELEFIVHAFQLVRGGRTPELRGGRILDILGVLARLELLPGYAVRELAAAYRFLRDTEHRLQQVDDQQVHRLPQDRFGRARLAAGMGFEDWDDYAAALARHVEDVRSHFEQILGPPPESAGPTGTGLDALSEDETGEATAVALLEDAGFDDGPGAWARIAKLRDGYRTRLAGERVQERLRRLLPTLVAAAAAHPHPGEVLRRLLSVVENVVTRGSYLALLLERPLALSHFVRLCAASPWIARQLAQQPTLLNELLDPGALYSPIRRAALEESVRAHLAGIDPDDTEQAMDLLRRQKQANVLRVAAAELSGSVPLMVVSDYLTEIAEVCLDQALLLSWRDLVKRYGEPRCRIDGETVTAGFVVIGYGKLGGLELSYGSDLDLVFLHDSAGEAQQTEGPKVVDNGLFFSRLGQRMIHYLSTVTGAGMLYEVDPRLRPSGASGLLVSGIDAFAEYQRTDAWTWEHQALVRARAVAGSEVLRERFAALRESILLLPREEETLRREVREMRARMRAELGAARHPDWDVKQDAGGIADIEFMVQYGALRWAPRLGKYLNFTDNVRLLEGFSDLGLMDREETEFLADAYRAYRARIHALDLQERPGRVDGSEFSDLRVRVEAIWRDLMEADTRDAG